MTDVIINEAGMKSLWEGPLSPLGQYIDERARGVEYRAHNRATGRPGPNIRSGALQAHLRYPGLVQEDGTIAAYIFSDAVSPRGNYPYPEALETGRDPVTGARLPYGPYPFLEPALREEFGV